MRSWHRKALWTFTRCGVCSGWKKVKSQFVDTFILRGDVGIIRLGTRSVIKVDIWGHTHRMCDVYQPGQ